MSNQEVRDRHEIIADLVNERKANYDLRAENERLRKALIEARIILRREGLKWAVEQIEAALSGEGTEEKR